jgi:hypothetical protein
MAQSGHNCFDSIIPCVQYSPCEIEYKFSDVFHALVYCCPEITDRCDFTIADWGGGFLWNVGRSPEDGGSRLFRNAYHHLPKYTES